MEEKTHTMQVYVLGTFLRTNAHADACDRM